MDNFKVLPTDPRFRSLTQEQIVLLVAMHNHAQRERAKAMRRASGKGGKGEIVEEYYDPDFDAYLAEVTQSQPHPSGSDREWLTL